MKVKNFKDYLENRLDKKEIEEIALLANREFEAIKVLQEDISRGIKKYMAKEKIGFNEMVKRLGVSASQMTKIQKGDANLTLASIAHIAALFGKKPHLMFKSF